MRSCAEALWLVGEEMRWSWRAYVLSVLIVLSLGLIGAVGLSLGVSEFEGYVLQEQRTQEFYGAFFVDYLFLLVFAVLGVNIIFRYYTRDWRGAFASRIRFFRGLPLSVGALVGSRALGTLFALIVGALAFFVPVYFVSDLGGELGIEAYLFFSAAWVGYGLLASGVAMFFEFGASGKSYAFISYGFAFPLVILVVLLESTQYAGIVGRVAWVAQGRYGTLLAGLSILMGCVAFLLLSGATVRRLRTRDLSV